MNFYMKIRDLQGKVWYVSVEKIDLIMVRQPGIPDSGCDLILSNGFTIQTDMTEKHFMIGENEIVERLRQELFMLDETATNDKSN